MKKIISIFLAVLVCTSFAGCGSSKKEESAADMPLTEEEEKIYEAISKSDYSYEKYGKVTACSNIYKYEYPHTESDELYPFIELDMSDNVDSYCYIDFANDEEDVCVLVTEGKNKGKITTYGSAVSLTASLYMEDLIKKYSEDELQEVFNGMGYPYFYVSDDSTINVKALSKKLKGDK